MRKARRTPTLISPAGFTLIELAIGMAVIGLMLGGALLVGGKVWERDRREETRAYMQEVKQALLAYARVNGALPRTDWNNVDGIADDYSSRLFPAGHWAPGPGTEVDWLYAPNSQNNVWLPYKTLQVPGKDAFGSQLHYNVHWQLTKDLATSCKTLNIYNKSGPLPVGGTAYFQWGKGRWVPVPNNPSYPLGGYWIPAYGWVPVIRWKQNGPIAIPPVPDLAVAAVIVSGGERSLDGSSGTKFENLDEGLTYYTFVGGYYPNYYEEDRDDIFEYVTLAELYNALGCSNAIKVEY